MRKGMSAFAATFHYRLAIAPREKHQVFSEILIETLELCDLAAQLIGGRIQVEDHKGKMRTVDTWARYFRLYMRQQGDPIDATELMDQVDEDDLPGNDEAELPEESELRFNIGPYPDLELDGRAVVRQALDLAQQTLGLIGISAWMHYEGEDYALSEFADHVLNGTLNEDHG